MSIFFVVTSCVLFLCCVSLLIEKKLNKRYRMSDTVIVKGHALDIYLKAFERAMTYPDDITGYALRFVTEDNPKRLRTSFQTLLKHVDAAVVVTGLTMFFYLYLASMEITYPLLTIGIMVSLMISLLVMYLPIIANFWNKQRRMAEVLWYMKQSNLSLKQKRRLASLFLRASEHSSYVMLDKIICFLAQCHDPSLIKDALPLFKGSKGTLPFALLMWCRKNNLSPIDALATSTGKAYQRELLTLSTMDNESIYKQCTKEGRGFMSLNHFFQAKHLPEHYQALIATT